MSDVLETTDGSLGAARLIIDAQRSEIQALQGDLRDALGLSLGQFAEKAPHFEIDETRRTYTIIRLFARTFPSESEAMQHIQVLRALLDPAAQGAPLNGRNGNGAH